MKSRTKSKARACSQPEVQISMPMQGVLQDVQQAFYGLCIEAGLRVLDVMMEADREALCGPKGVPDAQRRAVRGGHTSSPVVLGGQRIDIRRPRARALDAGELPLPTFAWAAGADPLNAATLAAVAAGVSTRRYASTLDPLPPKVRRSCASKSAVSRPLQGSQPAAARRLVEPAAGRLGSARRHDRRHSFRRPRGPHRPGGR